MGRRKREQRIGEGEKEWIGKLEGTEQEEIRITRAENMKKKRVQVLLNPHILYLALEHRVSGEAWVPLYSYHSWAKENSSH